MIRVCIAGRNHEAFTEQCLSSVLVQNGSFTIDWTDDASDTEGAFRYVEQRLFRGVIPFPDHHVERRVERRGGLANLWHAIQRAKDDDVCVLLGGDDWLELGAFKTIIKEYEDPHCWLTYGTYRNSNGAPALTQQWNGQDVRHQPFGFMPLTCRAWLAKKIHVEDLQIGGGFWQPSSGDIAITLPLLEMAGYERCRYIKTPYYMRRIHDGNDHAIDGKLQSFCNWLTYLRPKYSWLASRNTTPVRTPHVLRRSIWFRPDQPYGYQAPYPGSVLR